MNTTRANEIRNLLVALFVFVISAASIAALSFYFFIFGRPDGELRSPVAQFLLPAFAIYLFLTNVGALIAGRAWRAAAVWVSLIAAGPYLLLTVFGSGFGWLGVALFTFGAYFGATHLCNAKQKSTVA